MLIHKIQYHWQGWKTSSYRDLLCNQKCREDGVGYETTPGRQGAAVLLLLLISLSVCSVSSQTGLFHQSSSLYCLCHCSLFHSLPCTLHLSLYLSLPLCSSLFLPAPSARTSNSMVKYPGQCVALQRDSGSRYAGNGPGSKWGVIVEHCGCTSHGPQSSHIKGPHLGQNLPTRQLKYGL